MRKNISDESLKGRVRVLYQAINTISNNNDATQDYDIFVTVELLDILKKLVERKKLTKVERITHKKNKRVFLSQVFMDALYPLLFKDTEYDPSK